MSGNFFIDHGFTELTAATDIKLILVDPREIMMTKHSGYTAGSTGAVSMPVLQFDEFIGVSQISHGADVAPDGSSPTNSTDQSADSADHFAGIGDFLASVDSVGTLADNSDNFAFDNSAAISDNDSTSDQHPFVASSSDGDVSQTSDVGQNSISDVSLNANSTSGLSNAFNHIDNSNFSFAGSQSLATPTVGGPLNAPPGPFFDQSPTPSVDIPDVVSDARGHGGGGGGGGGTAPAPYTTNSGTGVNIHVVYDSSVGSAPAGFTSVVQQVADFFAGAFQDSTPITINIDVGFGEVDGMRLGIGAVGESVTNLQQVSYSQLTAAYSTSGLSLGNSVPSGNLYVSYAEAKALNIAITSPQSVDGWVGFSSKSGIFDYNNADGVSSNQYDFYGAVAHEFSEVMGRILLAGGTINNTASYMAYDFFHFTSPGIQDFSGNGGYFSKDNGTTNLANFNNPSNGGDAGDWASTGTSNSGGSVYDAFNAFDSTGHVAPVSQTDLAALQALGYQSHTLV